MPSILQCVIYLALIGLLSFLLGRLVPKAWFTGESYPLKDFPFEKQGRIYEKIKIKQWQDKLPDMSRILPKIMPHKRMEGQDSAGVLRMVQETGVAEFTHLLLAAAGFWCIKLWPGLGGVLVAAINFLGNMAFVLIQRYNRPRLQRLLSLCRRREAKTA